MPKIALALFTLLAFAIGFAFSSQERTAEEILAEINSLEYPMFDQSRMSDPTYFEEYRKLVIEVQQRQNELFWEFYEGHPDHEWTPRLLERRWMNMFEANSDVDATIKNIDEFIENEERENLLDAARFCRAYIQMSSNMDPAEMHKIAEQFHKEYPNSERGAMLYYMAVVYADAEHVESIQAALLEKYPDSMEANMIRGQQRQKESVGKPFEFEFEDAITGEKLTQADFKGKILVIDFWATWCGPCIAELPKLKELHSKYEGKMEIIGISLDGPGDAGLETLRKFVEENELPWPQFYQDGWEGEFSSAWGINAIPTIFLVDQNGILVDVEARANLAEKIEELLKED